MSDIQKAIEVIQTEKACVSRQQCDRDCGKCDLVMQADDILDAYAAAIAALREKQHNDELRQQGRLVELPCAIGEYVYRIVKTGASETYTIMHEGHEYSREVPFWGIWPCEFNLKLMDEFGKTVFPAYEAAQEALWEMEKAEGRR